MRRKLLLTAALAVVLCGVCALLLVGLGPSVSPAFESLKLEPPAYVAQLQDQVQQSVQAFRAQELPEAMSRQAADPVDFAAITDIDSEWLEFPRSHTSMRVMVFGGKLFDARNLYRHKLLNPEDTYIEPARRQNLADIAKALGPALDELHILRAQTASTELSTLVDRGLANNISRDDYYASMSPRGKRRLERVLLDDRAELLEEGLTPEEVEAVMATRIVIDDDELFGGRLQTVVRTGKVIYGATIDMLPHTQSVTIAQNEIAIEGLATVLIWFTSNGLLPSAQAANILQDFVTWVESRVYVDY